MCSLIDYPEFQNLCLLILDMEQGVIVGIDIGSWTFKICACANQRFDVLTNEANFRETPSLVSFHQNQRLVGEEAQNKFKSNYMNTVRAPLRLIGLQKSFELVEQELKCSPAKYQVEDELKFSIQFRERKEVKLQPEHFLISLMSKIHKIVSSHGLKSQGYYLTIPSYLSHYERKLIRRCGQMVLQSPKVVLIDDWLSLASDYAYHRVSDLKDNTRVVMFVDIGYSKCSYFVIQFNPNGARLLDCEHLRFMGSKNMDHLLIEFYDTLLKEDRGSNQSIFSSQKILVKMLEHIEQQRKVLSANEDSSIHIQSLFQDYDLKYIMKRGELEQIITPVLTKIKKGLASLKSRMPSGFQIYSIELVGGAARMPNVATIIRDVFGIQPSRTLNLTQATARGATVYGAVSSNIIPLSYRLSNFNLIDICVGWHSMQLGDNFLGQNQSQYPNKRTIFTANSHVPSQTFLAISGYGQVQLYIYYNQMVSRKSIGYLRFSAPNRIYFTIDESKIVSSYLQKGDFSLMKMQDKKEDKWKDLENWHEDIDIIEERIKCIYHLKNQHETKFYQIRQNLTEYIPYMNQEEHTSFRRQFTEIEDWIETENDRPLSTQQDLQQYNKELQRIKAYEEALNVLKLRKSRAERIKSRFQQLKEKIDSIPPSSMNPQQLKKIGQLVQWLKYSYAKMEQNHWEGYYLNDTFLGFAEEELSRIVRMQFQN